MSENNLRNDTSKDESKLQSESLSNAEQPDSNDKSSIEYNSKADAVLSDIKIDKSTKEIVIDIENDTINAVTGESKLPENLNFLLYGQYGQHIRPPRQTWVFFQKAGVPDDQAPLDYEPSSRNGFIRLVFLTVFVMLVITAGFVFTVLSSDSLKDFFKGKGFILALPALFIMIAISYMIALSPCTRSFPSNIIILLLAVICMSIICSWITSKTRVPIVFNALLATCIIVLICTLLALTGFDFTSWMLYLVIIGAAFSAVALVVMIGMWVTGTYMPIVHLVILTVGVLFNAIFLVVELQMVLGGKTIELGENDFALGAFLIYTSIIDIFLELVQMLGILDML